MALSAEDVMPMSSAVDVGVSIGHAIWLLPLLGESCPSQESNVAATAPQEWPPRYDSRSS